MSVPSTGKLLDRRYRIIRPLASGGFGQTYVAEDTRLPGNPLCVVKYLKPSNSDPVILENARRLFHTEAETLLRLGKYDQIPQILAFFEEDQEFYLVQELIEGHPLSTELLPGQRWTEIKVITLLQELLKILEVIHSDGIIHRDIKPDNVIRRSRDNKLVLVDFGTVKNVRSHYSVVGSSVATIATGTPGYMPTEQSHGKPRPNSDIYALGIVAIQALTGLYPSQLAEDAETGEILWFPWAQCSNRLTKVITKMVRYHFRDRYQTASEALGDLQSLLSTQLPDESLTIPEVHSSNQVYSPPSPPKSTVVSVEPSDPQNSEDSPSEQNSKQKLFSPLTPKTTIVSPRPFNSPASSEAVPPPSTKPEPFIVPKTIISSQIEDNPSSEQVPQTTVGSSQLTSCDPVSASEASSVKPTHPNETVVSLPLSSPNSVDESTTSSNTFYSRHQEIENRPQPQKTGLRNRQTWVLVGAIAFMVLPLTAYSFTQWKNYAAAELTLKKIITLRDQEKYQECINQARLFSQRHLQLVDVSTKLLEECFLGQELETLKNLQNQKKYEDCIVRASSFSQVYSNLYEKSQSILSECHLAQDNKTFTEAQEIASRGLSHLEEAIRRAEEIKSQSPVYTKAQAQILKWWEVVLESYLPNKLIQDKPQLRSIVESMKLEIELSSEEILISYDSSDTHSYTDDGLKYLVVIFMRYLSGNSKQNIAPKYPEFSQLIVHSRRSKREAVLTQEHWQAYVKENGVDDKLILQKVILRNSAN